MGSDQIRMAPHGRLVGNIQIDETRRSLPHVQLSWLPAYYLVRMLRRW